MYCTVLPQYMKFNMLVMLRALKFPVGHSHDKPHYIQPPVLYIAVHQLSQIAWQDYQSGLE